MNLEKFKKEFDEMMDNMSDEELVQEFTNMGCNVEIKKPVVVLLRGVSNSGKSSVANLFGENSVVCCADDYFTDKDGNYDFNPNLLGQAHTVCKFKFIDALHNPDIDTIVVSNTNTKPPDFQFYIDEAEKRGIMVFSLVVERRHGGINNHNVPAHVLERQAENIKNSLKLI